MTTITYRDGVMAADSRAFSGDSTPIGFRPKIHQTVASDGEVITFGVSTPNPGLSEQIAEWFYAEKNPDKLPNIAPDWNFYILEVLGSGEVYYYHNNFIPVGPLKTEFIAIGSGEQYALGAMESGLSAPEAVKVAAKFDPWTGGEIHSVRAVSETQEKNT